MSVVMVIFFKDGVDPQLGGLGPGCLDDIAHYHCALIAGSVEILRRDGLGTNFIKNRALAFPRLESHRFFGGGGAV